MSEQVTLFEVGPRDGLQNEQRMVPSAEKIQLVDALAECGVQKIEVSSFVSPKWVPQMADAADVFSGIRRYPGVTYAALTPNLTGFERALEAGADEVAVFAAASESFSQKNINCSIEESLQRFKPLMVAAREHRIPVRGYVSCVTDCPYESAVAPESVSRVAQQLLEAACYEISLGDTIGAATYDSLSRMLDCVARDIPPETLAGHYHDTAGRALENIDTSLQYGLRVFDAAVAGLGGCPYAPGAKGNVASESVVELLHEHGYDTGIDLDGLKRAASLAQTLVSQP